MASPQREVSGGVSAGSSDEESPRRRIEAKPRGAPPSKTAEACLDDVVMDSEPEENEMERDGVPEAVVVDAPDSRRTSMSSESPEPQKSLKVPEQHRRMESVSRNWKNKKGKDSDSKAFLSSDNDDDEYDPQIYKARQGGSQTYYDSDYQETRYSDDDYWNPWSCENILVGAQLVCCLIVVIAVIAAMVVPLFAHKLNSDMRIAVQTGNIEVVRVLLSNGSATHVDATGSRDMTALHWASMRGQTEVAELLLENRASTSKMSGSGLLPIHYAVRAGHKGVVSVLLEADPPADSNATDNNGWTPLHWAGIWGRADIARMLINADANPTVLCEDRAHKTALSLAQSNGHSALIRILDKAMEAYVERVNASLLLQLNSTHAQ